MKILLIEDDKKSADFIVKGLKQAGYVVDYSCDGADGLLSAVTRTFDAIILDLMLPTVDGLSILEQIRGKHIDTPVIILSAKGSVDDKIKGLQGGGDDYLAKPFAFSELLARLQALIRRSNAASEPTELVVGELKIDLLSRKVFRGNTKIDLQPLEFNLLEYLMRHTGRVVSKTMIMENVWEYNFDPQTNIVEARICKLRDKIDKPFASALIHTVRGFGYVLE